MNLHIRRFVDKLTALDSRGVKEFTMSMQDAKDLHADITRMLLDLETSAQRAEKSADIVQVTVAGGDF
jgi:NADH dehydrogenase FAD-containing subunit